MSNETIATETTEAVGELPIDEAPVRRHHQHAAVVRARHLGRRLRPRGDLLRRRPAQPHLISRRRRWLESMQRVVAERGAERLSVLRHRRHRGAASIGSPDRYNKRFGTDYTADDVLITTGSQQILDLLGKVLLDKGDGVIVEKPTYLAAIQAFALNQPTFHEVELTERRPEHRRAERGTRRRRENDLPYSELPESHGPHLLRPRGAAQVREALTGRNIVVVEDDPVRRAAFRRRVATLHRCDGACPTASSWGRSRRRSRPASAWATSSPRTTTLLKAIISTAKEAADLHTNVFAQYVIYGLPGCTTTWTSTWRRSAICTATRPAP